jgi:hypothetical protein
MAQTQTAVNACDVNIHLDNAAGNLTEISGSSNQCSLDITRNVAEVFTFDGDWSIKKSCKSSISVSIQALYSTIQNEAVDVLEDWIFDQPTASKTLRIDVPDSSVGSTRYEGEFIIESYGVPLAASEAGVIVCSATLSNDGAVTRSIIAS